MEMIKLYDFYKKTKDIEKMLEKTQSKPNIK